MSKYSQTIHSRTALLLGEDTVDALFGKKVILFGMGGVGSWCAEGLVRSGIGHLTIVDSDTVATSNVNRQLEATTATVGKVKVEVLRDRLLEINPDADIVAIRKVYSSETAAEFDLDTYDYVIDAIDSLRDKKELILNASASKATLFSSMGAALKVDPTKIRVAEFWNVKGCPLGAMIRKQFRKNGLAPAKKFLCVYDEEVLPNRGEQQAPATQDNAGSSQRASVNGSLVHITSIFGMTIAGLVVKDVYDSLAKEQA